MRVLSSGMARLQNICVLRAKPSPHDVVERTLGEQLKILSELQLDFDLEAIGFEVPEIDLLIDGLNTVPEADPDDRLPDVSKSATTVPVIYGS